MKLALVISSLSSGGAERVMSQLANHWAGRGDTVTLITLDAWSSDSYALHKRVRRVALGMVADSNGGGWTAIRSNGRRIAALRSALLAADAPVVLSFEGRTNVLVLLATLWTRMRCVVSERVNPSEHSIGTMWASLRRLTYPFADALVVQTTVAVAWARSIMLGPRRVHVIANPVRDMRAFVGDDAGKRLPTIVAVGRLAHQKGFDVLLRAFAQVAEAAPSWNVVIVGEGPERALLERLAKSLGIADRADLSGWHPEPGEVLRTAGLFVMPSRYEGFPNALIEAMACGAPVISTKWAGADEILTHEVDGLLVPGTTEHLAGAIRRAIEDSGVRSRLGRNARAVTDRYRLAAIIEKWDSVLTDSGQPLCPLRSCS